MLRESSRLPNDLFKYIQSIKTIFVHELPKDFYLVKNHIEKNYNETKYENRTEKVYSLDVKNITLLQENILNQQLKEYINIKDKKSDSAKKIKDIILSIIGNSYYIDIESPFISSFFYHLFQINDIDFFYSILSCKYFSFVDYIDNYDNIFDPSRIEHLTRKQNQLNKIYEKIKKLELNFKIDPKKYVHPKINVTINKIEKIKTNNNNQILILEALLLLSKHTEQLGMNTTMD